MNKTTASNFGLTEEEFSALSLRLAEGDERLFELAFLQHFQECRDFVVREDGASADLAYDATMDAFYAFRTKVKEGKINYGNLRFLLTRMARQYYLKSLRKEHEGTPEVFPEIPADDPVTFTEDAFAQLREGWQRLGDKCRSLLRAFYYEDLPLKEIALSTAENYATLRKRKQRCMDKLKGLMKG